MDDCFNIFNTYATSGCNTIYCNLPVSQNQLFSMVNVHTVNSCLLNVSIRQVYYFFWPTEKLLFQSYTLCMCHGPFPILCI
jgi:hypothetical protein